MFYMVGSAFIDLAYMVTFLSVRKFEQDRAGLNGVGLGAGAPLVKKKQ